MSTRATIGLRRADGKIDTIICWHDAFIGEAGHTLIDGTTAFSLSFEGPKSIKQYSLSGAPTAGSDARSPGYNAGHGQ